MQFNIKYGNEVYIVDDLLPLIKQSLQFQELFSSVQEPNGSCCQMAQFDNAMVMTFNADRLIVTLNNTDYNENI